MRSVRAIHAVGGVVIAVAACVTACAPPAETSPASQDVVVTATPAPTDAGSPAATPPAAVPDGFPVYPGAESVTTQAEPGLVARWIASADGAEVYEFYLRALPAAGLVIEQRLPGGAAAVIRFSVPDGQLLDVSLTASGIGTQVDLRLPDPAP